MKDSIIIIFGILLIGAALFLMVKDQEHDEFLQYLQSLLFPMVVENAREEITNNKADSLDNVTVKQAG